MLLTIDQSLLLLLYHLLLCTPTCTFDIMYRGVDHGGCGVLTP